MRLLCTLFTLALVTACEKWTPVTSPEATGATPVLRSSKRADVTLSPGEALLAAEVSNNHAAVVLSVTTRRADGSVVVYSIERGKLVERLIIHEYTEK
ncbi:MAG: hypothetical protein A2W26_02315 [Acidobacteria bacterium RBG_16_64_8]|nr:MAG: hypothetical protein A2W26_02315 [Acidobacteria bacterium RBG_16_64_8]